METASKQDGFKRERSREMLNKGRQRVSIALFLMAFLVFGSVSAYAGSTHGSDRLVKGAAIGAAAGAVTQMVRGRTTGKELLKGAAVGASVGAPFRSSCPVVPPRTIWVTAPAAAP